MHATAKQTSSSIKSFETETSHSTQLNHWRNAILSSFGYDPLECPICRHKMEFWNFILTISVFPSKNYMRDLCPDLAESVLLHNFLCFYGIIPS